MNTDLTVGKAEQVLWKFCIPLFGSIIFQQLYNLADSWVAGKFIGEPGAGRRGEQLRDHPHLPGICLWVQHWLLRDGIPALWREELPLT